jgi:hypothetical protein
MAPKSRRAIKKRAKAGKHGPDKRQGPAKGRVAKGKKVAPRPTAVRERTQRLAKTVKKKAETTLAAAKSTAAQVLQGLRAKIGSD